jgi:hypothetical protein
MASFKALFLAGERLDPDTLSWAQQHVHVPVFDHYWQVRSHNVSSHHCKYHTPHRTIMSPITCPLLPHRESRQVYRIDLSSFSETRVTCGCLLSFAHPYHGLACTVRLQICDANSTQSSDLALLSLFFAFSFLDKLTKSIVDHSSSSWCLLLTLVNKFCKKLEKPRFKAR